MHSPHLHVGASGFFSDFLKSVQMLKTEWGAESTGGYRTYSITGKAAALVPEFVVEDRPSEKQQPRFLRLHCWTSPWAEHSDDDDDNDDIMYLSSIPSFSGLISNSFPVIAN